MLGRKFVAFLTILAVTVFLASCGTKPATSPAQSSQAPASSAPAAPAPDKKVEIKWLQWWVNEWGPDNHAKLIADFEKANPNIKVTVVDIAYPQMAGKLNAAAAAGEVYDVFGTEGSWLPGLVKLGYVEPLDDWLNKDMATKNRIVDAGFRDFQGKIYSTCLYMNVYHFAYNVDLFKKHGWNPPTNWDEFVDVMKKARALGPKSYGMSMPLSDGGFILTRYFGLRLAQEGGRWLDENGKVVFNSPEGVAALNWWKDFYKQDLVVPGALGENQTLMVEYFGSGQVPGIIDGPFIYGKAKRIDPNINVAYAPAWKAKTGGYQWACSGVAVSAKSPNKEAAWKFMQYLYSDPVSVDMTKKISQLWATKASLEAAKTIDDPMLKAMSGFNQDPKHNLGFPVLPDGAKMIDAIKLAFQDVLTGKKDAKVALDEAAIVWQQAFDAAK